MVRAEFGPERPTVVLCTTEAAMDRIVEALWADAPPADPAANVATRTTIVLSTPYESRPVLGR